MTLRLIVPALAAAAAGFWFAGSAGCAAPCDKTATACPFNMYGTFAGNCLYGSPVWKECPDPHSICQTTEGCTGNPNGTCTYGGSSVASKYCCGSSTVVGSLDAPSNQTYSGELGLFCGTTAQRPGSQCCNGGRCGAIGGVCALSCGGGEQAAACPDGSQRCCSVNQVCCHDSAAGGAIGCEFAGFCQ